MVEGKKRLGQWLHIISIHLVSSSTNIQLSQQIGSKMLIGLFIYTFRDFEDFQNSYIKVNKIAKE